MRDLTLLPMLPTVASSLPQGKEWSYEVKWDGVRALCAVTPESGTRVISRRGHDRSDRYPELRSLHESILRSCVLDGEIVALSPSGKPDFARVLRRERTDQGMSATTGDPLHYIVFDVLMLDGQSLIDHPWRERRARLQGILPKEGTVKWSAEHADGAVLWEATRALGLEGVVAKLRHSRYLPGERSLWWRKLRHLQTTQALAFGLVISEGRPRSLLLCAWDAPDVYIGRVGSGVPQHLLSSLQALAVPSLSASEGYAFPLPHKLPLAGRDEQYWFLYAPVAVTIRFAEWTASGHLRQPVFTGLITV